MYLFKKKRKSKVKVTLSILFVFISISSFAQEQPKDSVKSIEEVLISAVRAKEKNPVTFTNVSKEVIS